MTLTTIKEYLNAFHLQIPHSKSRFGQTTVTFKMQIKDLHLRVETKTAILLEGNLKPKAYNSNIRD